MKSIKNINQYNLQLIRENLKSLTCGKKGINYDLWCNIWDNYRVSIERIIKINIVNMLFDEICKRKKL